MKNDFYDIVEELLSNNGNPYPKISFKKCCKVLNRLKILTETHEFSKINEEAISKDELRRALNNVLRIMNHILSDIPEDSMLKEDPGYISEKTFYVIDNLKPILDHD